MLPTFWKEFPPVFIDSWTTDNQKLAAQKMVLRIVGLEPDNLLTLLTEQDEDG